MDNINEGILKFWLIFEKLLNLKVKGIMSLILVIFFKVFVLKVNIYLQNMSITRRLARFDKTNVYFRGFCVCSLSPKIINFTCPNFRTTSAMALMLTLQQLSTLPSIPSNSHVGSLCYFLSIIMRQNLFHVYFFSRFS